MQHQRCRASGEDLAGRLREDDEKVVQGTPCNVCPYLDSHVLYTLSDRVTLPGEFLSPAVPAGQLPAMNHTPALPLR